VLPEDEERRLETETQKLTDRFIAVVDDLLKKKTAEVMEV
jgi:ribosome recycling factor